MDLAHFHALIHSIVRAYSRPSSGRDGGRKPFFQCDISQIFNSLPSLHAILSRKTIRRSVLLTFVLGKHVKLAHLSASWGAMYYWKWANYFFRNAENCGVALVKFLGIANANEKNHLAESHKTSPTMADRIERASGKERKRAIYHTVLSPLFWQFYRPKIAPMPRRKLS